MGPGQHSPRSPPHHYLFKVGAVQVDSPEMLRVPLFLKCSSHVNQRSKNKQLKFITEVKLKHAQFGRGWGWRRPVTT